MWVLRCITQDLLLGCTDSLLQSVGSVVVGGEHSCSSAHGILVPWAGIEPCIARQILNYSTTREVPKSGCTFNSQCSGALVGKNPPARAGDVRDTGSIPGWGRSPWRRACQPTVFFLPGESHGHRNLVGYSPWGHKESDTTEASQHARSNMCVLNQMHSLNHSVILYSLSSFYLLRLTLYWRRYIRLLRDHHRFVYNSIQFFQFFMYFKPWLCLSHHLFIQQ